AENARRVGELIKTGLEELGHSYPSVIQGARGLGLMIGMELAANIPNLPGDPSKTQAVRVANLLHAAGLLTIPAGPNILRFLPALNLRAEEATEGLHILEKVASKLAG
ncbi:MAG: aminotransferase class III-fold pyridoxal phosphate-dependent enzyme, partial [Limisphaerales bacterium]